MPRGCLAFMRALAVVIALLELAPAPVAGQAPATVAKAGPAPKTAWGESDLQGIWTTTTTIPLQRPTRYANKEFFTDAERTELDQRIAGILGRELDRRPRGTEQDVAGAYNQTIFTSHLPTGRRTSLIVDPPDGRIPFDANTIDYAVTINDPTTWTKPWTVKQELNRQDERANRIYYEPRCHEGNYGLVGLLLGARAEEKAFAEGRGTDPATKCSAGCGGFAAGFADEREDSSPLDQ